jgi:hypothetical protein
MASNSKKTAKKRSIKLKKMGRKRKTSTAQKGSTPKFKVHPEK